MKVNKNMNKKYTKKQIIESIAYWEKYLQLNESFNKKPTFEICPNDSITLTYSQLKKLIQESILDESNIGKNESDVAIAVFNALSRDFGNLPGMIVHENGSIEYNGKFYAKASKRTQLNPEEMKSLYKNRGAIKMQPDIDNDLKIKPNYDTNYGKGNTTAQAKLLNLKNECLGTFYDHYSWAVFELGSLQYPGDVVVVFSEASNSAVSSATSGSGITSVIEVKSDSLGNRVFNPSFRIKQDDSGYFIEPSGRYGQIWFDVLDQINNELSQKKYQDAIALAYQNKKSSILLYKFPLDVDFEDFIGRYASKNPFGPIEYIAMGYGDDITLYKLCREPHMQLKGRGQSNRLLKRNAEDIGGIFNTAYLTLRFRDDRSSLAGRVDFGHNGALMINDTDLTISFKR